MGASLFHYLPAVQDIAYEAGVETVLTLIFQTSQKKDFKVWQWKSKTWQEPKKVV